MVDKTRMGKLHEEFIADQLGGSTTRGSGNQWSDPNDTRDNHHAVPFALSFQCKSTAGQSLSVSRDVVLKAVEEAGGELPALALRWYPNERLDHLGINDDWAALRTADLDEILAAARSVDRLQLAISELDRRLAQEKWDQDLRSKLRDAGESPDGEAQIAAGDHAQVTVHPHGQEHVSVDGNDLDSAALASLIEELQEAGRNVFGWPGVALGAGPSLPDGGEEAPEDEQPVPRIAQLEAMLADAERENDRLRSGSIAPDGTILVRTPDDWTDEDVYQFEMEFAAELSRRRNPGQPDTVIVYAFRTGLEPERMKFQGVRINSYGVRQEFPVGTIHIDRSPDNKPRLFIDDVLAPRGEYWLDGKLQCRTYDPVLG